MATAKWAALVDDVVVPMPRQKVKVRVILAQANVPEGFVLVRDHNSPNDVVLKGDDEIDLAEGNVFYRLATCDVQQRERCDSPPKLAFFVDDRFEVTTNLSQTGQSLCDLFGLAPHAQLFRDYESPRDVAIAVDMKLTFVEGPVFFSREVESKLRITVNCQVFTEANGVKPDMTGLQIASLIYSEKPRETEVKWQSNGNRIVAHDESIRLQGCDIFNVTRCSVIGGHELSRVERELDLLRQGGAKVTLVTTPQLAIIYHDVPTKPGAMPSHSDVMVLVPSGYPGTRIDGAHLPAGSPLIGRVAGKAQHNVTLADRTWQLISYHPHESGGAPAWNPTKHGFHTYYGEVLSWLHAAKQ